MDNEKNGKKPGTPSVPGLKIFCTTIFTLKNTFSPGPYVDIQFAQFSLQQRKLGILIIKIHKSMHFFAMNL